MSGNRQGFTLIELLVVIAIIGVLSSVVLAALNGAREKGRDARRMSDVQQIRQAINLYALENNGTYPSTGGSLVCLGVPSSGKCWGNTVTGSDTLIAALLPYMKTIPTDPISNRIYNAYTYRSNGSGQIRCQSYPDSGGVWHDVYGEYCLSWKPKEVDAYTPVAADCTRNGGQWGAWDDPPGSTHCAPGGTCRQCGYVGN